MNFFFFLFLLFFFFFFFFLGGWASRVMLILWFRRHFRTILHSKGNRIFHDFVWNCFFTILLKERLRFHQILILTLCCCVFVFFSNYYQAFYLLVLPFRPCVGDGENAGQCRRKVWYDVLGRREERLYRICKGQVELSCYRCKFHSEAWSIGFKKI